MDPRLAASEIEVLLRKVGDIALKMQAGVAVDYKDGDQIVTAADLRISGEIKKLLARYFKLINHSHIDEEQKNADPQTGFSTEYQWIIDPIDGTASFAAGRDRWGISLGLLRRGKPFAGGVYLPALGKMLLLRDGKAVCIDTRTHATKVLQAQPREMKSHVFVESYFGEGHEWKHHRQFAHLRIWLHTPESAVQGIYSTLMNQSAGMVFVPGFSAWDVAGAFVLAAPAGFEIRSLDYKTRVWRQFKAENFQPGWKLNESWVMCHPAHYEYIRDALVHGK